MCKAKPFGTISEEIDEDEANETEEALKTSLNEQSNSNLSLSSNLTVSSYVPVSSNAPNSSNELIPSHALVSSNIPVSLNAFIPSNLPSNETLTSSTTSNVFEELKAYIDIIVRQRDEMQQEIVRLLNRLNEQCDKYEELHKQYRQFR